MKKLFLIAIFAVLAINSSHSQDLLWAVDTDTLGFEWAEALLIGAGNEAYISGFGEEEMYLLQYDNHGSIEFANVEMGTGYFEAMTLGNNGNVYMVGERTVGQQEDAVLHAYEADGIPIFTRTYDQYGKDDIFYDVCIGPNNNIFVCGSSYKASTEQVSVVAKFGPGGAGIWFNEFGEPGDQCRLESIHLTESGEVYASGRRRNTSTSLIEFLLVHYDENGNSISEQTGTLSGYSDCIPAFSLMDDDENIYIGGYVKNWDPPNAGFLMKISNGIVVWSHIIPNSGNSIELDGGMFGPEGNIICYGITYNGNDYDGYYVQFSPGGGMLHENIYAGPNNANDVITNIFVKEEYIYLCGGTYEPTYSFDMLALKLNSDFELMWELIYNSSANGSEQANAIAVDLDNHVLLAGLSVTATTTNHAALAKFVNPVGMNEFTGTEIHPVEVYPNPAGSILNFNLEAESEYARYNVSNNRGQIVQSGYIIDTPEQQISLGTLHSGIYFLQILDGKMQYNAKFVKK